MPELDESLLVKIGTGDMEAFSELYRSTDRSVYAFALSILKNKEDAQDVMHDTYLKIQSAAAGYTPMGKPFAWIFTIVKNLARMKLREKQRIVQDAEPELAQGNSHVELTVETNGEDALLLAAALELLSEEERQIVLLHAVSGFLHREIAELLELPLSTVLSKYRRALQKLKKHLGGGEQA